MRSINDNKSNYTKETEFVTEFMNQNKIHVPDMAKAHGRHIPYQDDFFKVKEGMNENYENE